MLLCHLTVLIIDEVSMVKSDLLYQLHLRLQMIKQNKEDFGGVSIILLGDLFQLRPVFANFIFDAPKSGVVEPVDIARPVSAKTPESLKVAISTTTLQDVFVELALA